jgi:hypothetical protein
MSSDDEKSRGLSSLDIRISPRVIAMQKVAESPAVSFFINTRSAAVAKVVGAKHHRLAITSHGEWPAQLSVFK